MLNCLYIFLVSKVVTPASCQLTLNFAEMNIGTTLILVIPLTIIRISLYQQLKLLKDERALLYSRRHVMLP